MEPTAFGQFVAFVLVASLVASPLGVACCVWKVLFGKVAQPGSDNDRY